MKLAFSIKVTVTYLSKKMVLCGGSQNENNGNVNQSSDQTTYVTMNSFSHSPLKGLVM